MKKLLLMAMLLIASKATALQFVSNTLSVSGDWADDAFFPFDDEVTGAPRIITDNLTGTFHETTQGSLNFAFLSPRGRQEASVQLTSSTLTMNGYSSADSLFSPDGWVEGGHINVEASSVSIIHFDSPIIEMSVESGNTWINYSDYGEQDVSVRLEDVTSGSVLLNKEAQQHKRVPQYFALNVDPSHEYRLSITGWIYARDAKLVENMHLNTAFRELPVPDTGASGTLLLFAMGTLTFASGCVRNSAVSKLRKTH